MRANEPYVDNAIKVIDLGHDTIMVACDIEDHSVTLQHADGPEVESYCRWGGPIGSRDFLMPGFQGTFRVRCRFQKSRSVRLAMMRTQIL